MSKGAFSKQTKSCSIRPCDRPFYARDWCKPHYNQMIKRTPGITGRVCGIDGCGATHYGLGYCRKHWERNQLHGDPHYVKALQGAAVAERLAARSSEVDGCVEWTGYRDKDGYGSIAIGGRSFRASRIAYEEVHGAIPDGMVIRHKCDNPPCIRIEHLELGTHWDNSQDKVTRGRSTAGEKNPSARLTSDKVIEIFDRHTNGETQTALARDFSVGKSTVNRIVRGLSWSSVTGSRHE